MISGTSATTTLDAAGVLAAARRARRAENHAAADVLAQAVEWARLHEVTDLDEAATWLVEQGRDTAIPIAGQGAPLVSEFAVAEFATALGLSAGAGRNLVGQALELAHRLPRLWARVRAGQLAPWRARRIAEHTLSLSAEAAGWVDAQVAPFAHRTGPAQTQRLVEEAIGRFMPDHAAQLRQAAAEGRYFSVDHDQVSFAGTSRVHGELDLTDALDLDHAVTAGAAQLAALGNTESLDVRRSLAVGMLARGQHALDFDTDTDVVSTGSVSTGSTTDVVSTGSTTDRVRGREVVLYVHLPADALRTGDPGDPDAPVWVENAGGRLLTAAQVATWCRARESKVTVRPVLDLNTPAASDGYAVPERIAEQVRLRDTRWNLGSHATPWLSAVLVSISSSISAGVRKPCRLRGRELSSAAMLSSMPGP